MLLAFLILLMGLMFILLCLLSLAAVADHRDCQWAGDLELILEL